MKKLAGLESIITEAYNNGMTYTELGTMYGCSEGTIRRIVLKEGGNRRGPGRRPGTTNKKTTPVVEENLNGVQQ